MLRVAIHSSTLRERSPLNQVAILDIAYHNREMLPNYLVAMTVSGAGALQPGIVEKYPRWSGSLWDLVARALATLLYPQAAVPPTHSPDRRCAYTTVACATLEKSSLTERGVHLGSLEIAQAGKQRGVYRVTMDEDILGERGADFAYGCKRMSLPDLVMRSICHVLFDQDVAGARPKLVVPETLLIDGEERFDIQSLAEPARTGFMRFMHQHFPARADDQLARAKDYIEFLKV